MADIMGLIMETRADVLALKPEKIPNVAEIEEIVKEPQTAGAGPGG